MKCLMSSDKCPKDKKIKPLSEACQACELFFGREKIPAGENKGEWRMYCRWKKTRRKKIKV